MPSLQLTFDTPLEPELSFKSLMATGRRLISLNVHLHSILLLVFSDTIACAIRRNASTIILLALRLPTPYFSMFHPSDKQKHATNALLEGR